AVYAGHPFSFQAHCLAGIDPCRDVYLERLHCPAGCRRILEADHLIASEGSLIKADLYLRAYILALPAEVPAVSAVMEDISENIPEHIVHIAAFKMILLISALRAAVCTPESPGSARAAGTVPC